MSYELFIDGAKADLGQEVPVTFQGVDLSAIDKPRAPYSGTIELQHSSRNTELFNSPKEINIEDLAGYESRLITITAAGVPVIFNGRAFLESTSENGMSMNVVGKDVDVFKRLGGKTLRELSGFFDSNGVPIVTQPPNFPSYDIRFGHLETWVLPDYTISSPIQGSFNVVQRQLNSYHCIPYMKKSTLVRYIIADTGYSLSDADILFHEDYAQSYVSMKVFENQSVFTAAVNFGLKDQFDVTAEEFLKSVMLQYGLVFIVNGDNLRITTLNKLVELKGSAYEWKGKIVGNKEVSYDSGYGYRNAFKYSAVEVDQNLTFRSYTPDGELLSENENLDDVDVMELVFSDVATLSLTHDLSPTGRPRQILHVPTITFDEDSNTYKFTESYPLHDIIIPDSPTTYKNGSLVTESWATAITGTVANGSIYPAWKIEQESSIYVNNGGETAGLGWDKLIPTFWNHNFIKRPMVINCRMALSANDVKRFSGQGGLDEYDPIIPVYIPEWSAYFHVNKISSWVNGRVANVELIRL